MSNFRPKFSFSFLSLAWGAVGALFIVYIGLIAVIVSYAAFTVEFSQSVKNNEATVALLESKYLALVARVTNTDYKAEGYAPPIAKVFVPAKSVTALR